MGATGDEHSGPHPLDGWAGRSSQEVLVVDETTKRDRIQAITSRAPGRPLPLAGARSNGPGAQALRDSAGGRL